MSAFAAEGPSGFVICGLVSGHSGAPAGDRKDQNPAPQCPFCFVAAQTAGNTALAGEAPAVLPYASTPVVAVLDRAGDRTFIPAVRRTTGYPRAPPVSSV